MTDQIEMADVHDKKTRSYNMSQIKGKDTRPEMIVRKFLHHHGFRYRLHDKKLPGKPDIVLPKYKAAIFVNGCFWHGHKGCKYFVIPKTRRDWWIKKINRTRELDSKNTATLRNLGWRVIELFECQLKNPGVKEVLTNLKTELLQNEYSRN